jgi:hypothetical protein
MTRKQKYLLALILLLSLVAFMIVLLTNNANNSLSDAQIKEKFACNRLTLEYRETDIFCTRPELYRNPDMTEVEYTAWQRTGCEERLKTPLTQEQRSNDEAMARAYDDCANKPSLHDKYEKFIQDVKRLRQAN